jgi:hypothetical protein
MVTLGGLYFGGGLPIMADMVDIRTVDRDEIVKRLWEFEAQYDMPTSDFVLAFRNGRLHETPDFHRWAHLASALHLWDRRAVRA